MSASASLIPELEDVIQHGSQDKRAATVKRIANLFVDGAPHFNEDHIGLFDDVLCRLIVEIETKARAEMAQTLAPMTQRADRVDAPARARRRYRGGRSGAHAIGPAEGNRAGRIGPAPRVRRISPSSPAAQGIGEAVTDVLVRRGDTEVMHNVADNQTAKLSEGGFSALVKRAEGDGDLAEKVGQRPDIPAHLFRDLLVRATAVVQQRLLQAAKPETRSEIQRVLEKVSKEFDNSTPARDYAAAQRVVLALHQTGGLGEPELAEFAKDKKFEETVASLSLLVRRADRDRGPADGRRPAGSDPDPLQGRRIRLDHRAGDHHVAPERQGHFDAGARRRLHQLREAVAFDRATRGAVLAGAPARRRDGLDFSPSLPFENQITRHAAFALGLGLIARAGKARPGLPPIVGLLGASR